MPEEYLHVAAIKVRVVGQGLLVPTLYGLNKLNSNTLAFINMQQTTPDEPRILAGFIDQRIMLRLEHDNINELMRVNRIIIYVKPIWTQIPG